MAELTKAQLDTLLSDLLKLHGQFRTLLENSGDGARPVALDQPIGRLSRMDALQQQNMSQANQRMARQRLAQMDAALQRASLGEYGICLECGENIGYGRLRARPEAPFCFECQSQRERK